MREYSEEEKIKFVRGYKSCTLPVSEYSSKMKIDENDLKEWLVEYKDLPKFGMIKIDKTDEVKH